MQPREFVCGVFVGRHFYSIEREITSVLLLIHIKAVPVSK